MGTDKLPIRYRKVVRGDPMMSPRHHDGLRKEGTYEAEHSASLSRGARARMNMYHDTMGRLRPSITNHQKRLGLDMPMRAASSSPHARLLHTSYRARQHAATASLEPESPGPPPPPPTDTGTPGRGPDIRTRLRQWQELHGNKDEDAKMEATFDNDIDTVGGSSNTLTRLPDIASSLHSEDQDQDEERQALAHFMHSTPDDMDSSTFDQRVLRMGDLVELEFTKSERESVIAVFVRPLRSGEAQFFTMHGRWLHVPDRMIPYSIPGWVSPDIVKPLLEHLPEPKDSKEDEELNELAYSEDLSVPRAVAAPLVSRMVQFQAESQEIYRKHAGTLDEAHRILAHETDLRYGSLLSAATTLLQMPADKLPVTALFTVRSALTRAGFAFNIDRRSHRLTGYLQIRSKEQVKMVDYVRKWIRDWQDDMATRSALEGSPNGEKLLRKHKTPPTAQNMYGFIEKARKIVLQSREDREPTFSGNVGPSKKRFPITPESDAVRVKTDLQFTDQETEVVRFIEAWSCSNIFMGVPRLQSLPPLILQAIGLYEEQELVSSTGFMFLQELGAIMPYENRVRFDQHLLLPSSQHSKPLQNLMQSLLDMRNRHNFSDAMKGLRHDWGNMPVYCIDDASAHEIDDGLSIERAGTDDWWVHIHVANPTAFFERDHPLAKMARHMGESIYMPERTYMMLPRWATSRHFNLANDRPCLTFSAKLNRDGKRLEQKVTSGIIRNAVRLTKEEVKDLMGLHDMAGPNQKIALTVGGELPPRKPRKSMAGEINAQQVDDLRTLLMLAEKRVDVRKQGGGVFFNADKPDVEVWQNYKSPGLAWDHPHRRGRRTVEGDPVIRMETTGQTNWFAAASSPVQVLVQEMMLLACETSAKWCAERQVPGIFRGTLSKPGQPDPEKFLREVLEPATARSVDGERPMHLGLDYVSAIGSTAMSTTPFKHKILGMDYYGKVTSPLRRYGDMILHWQIEAALREEARRGKSLVTKDKSADRSFLPFSRTVLDTIMLGLQPREAMINRAKGYAANFWTTMLMFRAFHFGECESPFRTPADPSKPLMQLYVHVQEGSNRSTVHGWSRDLNIQASMSRPEKLGLPEPMRGDVWEVEVEKVDVYNRHTAVRPVRLLERAEVHSPTGLPY
ncbi:3'-5' RNA exonuclease complex component [Vermiconidia calcicola]|uniref:3'-5' RNA exonuclease complex component n=1 Tax=Vermiconidia calcicola TaxID=1690605 RepID=A0ACC3NG66_9PEZI|nr:3'-5' RNA exonuclease complex component [Vermiconidia calcicola]